MIKQFRSETNIKHKSARSQRRAQKKQSAEKTERRAQGEQHAVSAERRAQRKQTQGEQIWTRE